METIRAFLAIPTPEEARRAIGGVVKRLQPTCPRARFVPPQQWHVTLHFFAALSADQVRGVCEAAREAVQGLAPFEMALKGVGCFPDARRPRVLWLGVLDGARECALLHEALRRGLVARQVPVEDRPFRPHLTLARFRDRFFGARWPEEASSEIARFSVARVVLYRSVLSPRGAEHTALEEFALGGGQG